MAGALFVAHEHVPHRILLDDLVIDRQDRATRIAEDIGDALVDQGLDNHVGARHLPAFALPFHRTSSPFAFCPAPALAPDHSRPA